MKAKIGDFRPKSLEVIFSLIQYIKSNLDEVYEEYSDFVFNKLPQQRKVLNESASLEIVPAKSESVRKINEICFQEQEAFHKAFDGLNPKMFNNFKQSKENYIECLNKVNKHI